ncbi:pyruvate dehydrogenase kinase [Cystoisospora suis]|uniref:Protein-serine/threonine kinase n=1 Tax=Cystoisospora suis TaxID=483139 RepID=A0A2C6KM82_9APIC|nr:pyruvate dehydrogenase kinase [Cystoisospora suis]
MARGATLGGPVGQKAASFLRQSYVPSCSCLLSSFSSLFPCSRGQPLPLSLLPFSVASCSPEMTFSRKLCRSFLPPKVFSSVPCVTSRKRGCLCAPHLSSAETKDCFRIPQAGQSAFRLDMNTSFSSHERTGEKGSFAILHHSASSSASSIWTGAGDEVGFSTVASSPCLSASPGSRLTERPEGGGIYAVQRRCFTVTPSSGGSQVILSKERHDQLLMAEITEFAMRSCRPLALHEIAYLKGPYTAGSSQSTSSTPLLPDHPDGCGDACAFSHGKEDSVEQFLSVELPVRFASRIKQIEALPMFNEERLVLQVRQLYVESFKQLRMCSWSNKEDFARLLKNLKRRHAPIAPLLVTGMRNLKRRWPQIFTDAFVDEFLNSFFLSRIGTEMLTSAYLSPKGIVDSAGVNLGSIPLSAFSLVFLSAECDPMQVIKKAAGDAEKLCHYHYGCCPRVMIWNHEKERFACVPQYLYYILFELFKNAMRATVERFGSAFASTRGDIQVARRQDKSRSLLSRGASHFREDEADDSTASLWYSGRGGDSSAGGAVLSADEYDASVVYFGRPPHYETSIAETDTKLPPIQIVVSGDDRVIAIKSGCYMGCCWPYSGVVFAEMSDQGGGVGQESTEKIWSYMYTTARPVEIGISHQETRTVTVTDPPSNGAPSSPPTVGSLDAAPPMIPGAAVVPVSASGSSGCYIGSQSGVSTASSSPASREDCPDPCSGGDVKSRAFSPESGSRTSSGTSEADKPSNGTQHIAHRQAESAVGTGPSPVSPLAGFGCGLPLSRLYASYLGGRLDILSLPFHGSDAYLYLNRIGDKERMPPSTFPLGASVGGEIRTAEELERLSLPRD